MRQSKDLFIPYYHLLPASRRWPRPFQRCAARPARLGYLLLAARSARMRRAGSTRAASPTNTTYSGISNYRTDSYRPLPNNAAAQFAAPDPRTVARVHFDELSSYLASYLAKGTSVRSRSARIHPPSPPPPPPSPVLAYDVCMRGWFAIARQRSLWRRMLQCTITARRPVATPFFSPSSVVRMHADPSAV